MIVSQQRSHPSGMPARHSRNAGSGLLSGLAEAIGAYRRHARDYRHLQKLPDYLLDDVGLTRADVCASSRGQA